MSHPEQLGYFRAISTANSELLAKGRLLEIGSYDVNGNVRRILAAGEHVGVDLAPGPSVDRIGFGHEVSDPDGSFDAAVSGECFEHDPHWRETFANMTRLTRPGGLVAFSCASRGRPEHGTSRSDVALSPGTQAVGLDYYRNLVAEDFLGLPLDEWFSEWRFWRLSTNFDLYFAGVRAGDTDGAPSASLPADQDVRALSQLMPIPHRLARLPLRILAATDVSEPKYQDRVLAYWQTLQRAFGGVAARQ